MSTGKPRKAAARKVAASKTAPTSRRTRPASGASLADIAVAVDEQKVRDALTTKRAPKKQPATRKGKKGLVLYVEPAVTVALRRLALDTGKSVQELGMEALNGLFRSHRLPEFPLETKDVR